MRKEEKSLSGTSTMEPTRDGRLSMRRTKKKFKMKVS
jgi:hypothetical protein